MLFGREMHSKRFVNPMKTVRKGFQHASILWLQIICEHCGNDRAKSLKALHELDFKDMEQSPELGHAVYL